MMSARHPAPAPGHSRRDAALTARLVELFYVEALLLLDEAQSYCDHPDLEAGRMPPEAKAAIGEAFEILFARLDAVLAWLRARRGDAPDASALGAVAGQGEDRIEHLPPPARALVGSGLDLYERIQRLEAGDMPRPAPSSPARDLQGRLRSSF